MKLSYPQVGSKFADATNLGGFLHFGAREFENTLDDQSQASSGGRGPAGTVHSITLPYPSVTTSESSVWDYGDNDTAYGFTDIDWRGLGWRAFDAILNIFGRSSYADEIQMGLNMAGFKNSTLRQRHYTWNLVNREKGDGEEIAKICRVFQACAYPRLSVGKEGNEFVNPPPMWTVAFMKPDRSPNDISPLFGGSGITPSQLESQQLFGRVSFDAAGELIGDDPSDYLGDPNKPVTAWTGFTTNDIFVRPGQWRWHMDQFQSVVVRAEISPTKATDGTMVKVGHDGFPLVTTLQVSFMEVAQVVANLGWDHLLPYPIASDSDTPGVMGSGGAASPL